MWLKRIKIALALVAGFLLIIVILQNTDTVQTRVLSVTIEMPRAVLLLATLAAGYVLGFATAFWRERRRRYKSAAAADAAPAAPPDAAAAAELSASGEPRAG
ncbi:MAG: DUF1049 domain-containing protein [Planctomycetes bacterium]|nr:DUF1049 domain-containing protein [Planctomycetota bacterium]